jgi:hypothetical protein
MARRWGAGVGPIVECECVPFEPSLNRIDLLAIGSSDCLTAEIMPPRTRARLVGAVWWSFAVGVLTTVRGWCTVSFVMVIPLGVAGEHRIRLGHRVLWLTSSA